MLKTPIWENLFKLSHSLQSYSYEFYADLAFQRFFTFEPKTARSMSYETGGAQLILQSSPEVRTFHSSLLDASSFSGLIENQAPTSFPGSFSRSSEPCTKSWDRAREIEQTCRRILLDLGNLTEFKARYEETNKFFLFAKSSSGLHEGQENLACFTVEFSAQKGDQTRHFKFKRGRTDFDSLRSDFEKTFMSRENLEKALQQPWPAPKGSLGILWSASCVAKLLLHLLQFYEFLSQTSDSFESLVNQFPQTAFQVIDNWKQGNRVDVEGRPRTETLLVDGGRFVGPFNELLPGFSRRHSFRDFPITAPWEPALFGRERDSNVLSQLGNGLSIRELDVLDFQPSTGRISLRISEAALVHQGVEGEFIDSVRWELSLLELLSSFKLFSDSSYPHPLIWYRSGQQLFVEVTTPEALSPALEFPGSVPLSHYW